MHILSKRKFICVMLITKRLIIKLKWLIIILKGLYTTTCYKAKFNFSHFFFSDWLLHKGFFSFLIKAFANFEKLIKFRWLAFIVCKSLDPPLRRYHNNTYKRKISEALFMKQYRLSLNDQGKSFSLQLFSWFLWVFFLHLAAFTVWYNQ